MKVNVEKLTEALNKLRMDSKNKVFTTSELQENLSKIGFGKNIISLMQKHQMFDFEQMGCSKLYSFKKEPIHMERIKNLYNENRRYKNSYTARKNNIEKKALNEQEALDILQKQGYRIQKCMGFDLERFQKEQPVMYKRYLKYESV
jgi:hypothetical protein